MFSQRRRNYRNWIWAAIACAAVAFAVIVLLGYLGRNNDPVYEETNGSKPVYENQIAMENCDAYDEDDAGEQASVSGNTDGEEKLLQSYYLVKYDNDVIRIYFSDQTGRIMELEETTIVYETLSQEDQNRFRSGVKLNDRDALNKLLMDYES